GIWGERMADQRCQSHRFGSVYWGTLELVDTVSADGFTIKWGYCESTTRDRIWVFHNKIDGSADVIDRYATAIRERLHLSGPTPSGDAVQATTVDEALSYSTTLRKLDYTPPELTILSRQIAKDGDTIDLRMALDFLNLAMDMRTTHLQAKTRPLAQKMLIEQFQIPQAAFDHLESNFFISERLMDPVLAQAYAGDFMRYSLDAVMGNFPGFDKFLSSDKKAELATWLENIRGDNNLPSMRASDSGIIDCRFAAVLNRMRKDNPKFDIDWQIVTGDGQLIGPGGLTHLVGKGAYAKRQVLVAGVRMQMAKCERER
ncbi:MAG: hypothetical protein P8L32_03555, partial [Paracoccaceae bacterium]|nr:hypothetical protein [Paracoccaceae bacterium]